MAALLLIALVLAATCFLHTRAQLTDAVCLTRYAWMSNSRGQNPCLVTAYLGIPCFGIQSKVYKLDSPRQYYVDPQPDYLECACNTVLYSMLEACQVCQFGVTELVLPWTGFTMNCINVAFKSYPHAIPPGTAIPAWAFVDVTISDLFNVTAALNVANANLPDSTASPSTLTSSTSTSITVTFSTASITTTTTTSSNTSSQQITAPLPSATGEGAKSVSGSTKSSMVGPIVGGVVGGVLGFLLVGVLTVYLLRRRNIAGVAEAQTEPSTSSEGVPPGPYVRDAVISPSISMIYDPDDPRTFPPEQPVIAQQTASLAGSSSGHMRETSFLPGYDSSPGRYPNLVSSTYKGSPEV